MNAFRLAVATAVAALAMHADVVFDNIFCPTAGQDSVAGDGPLYDSFTPTSTSDLSGLILLVQGPLAPLSLSPAASTSTLDIGLYADSSTSHGALMAMLATVSDSSVPASLGQYTVTLASNPELMAGTRYWIGLSGNTGVFWAWDDGAFGVGVDGQYYDNVDGISSDATGPYQMELTTNSTAPEPPSLLLLASGFATVILLKRHCCPAQT